MKNNDTNDTYDIKPANEMRDHNFSQFLQVFPIDKQVPD